jgi:hypothetical protein
MFMLLKKKLELPEYWNVDKKESYYNISVSPRAN